MLPFYCYFFTIDYANNTNYILENSAGHSEKTKTVDYIKTFKKKKKQVQAYCYRNRQ